MTPLQSRVCAAGVLAVFAACGDDKPASPGTSLGTGSSAGNTNGPELDAGDTLDSSAPDGGATPTGFSCKIEDGDELVDPLHSLEGQPIGSASLGNTLHVAYRTNTCGGQETAGALTYATFDTSGALGAPVRLVNGDDSVCYQARSPSLLAYRDDVRGEDVSVLYFIANNSGTIELYRRELAPNAFEPTGSEVGELVTSTGLTTRIEMWSAAAVLNGRPLVAWASMLDGATNADVLVQRVDDVTSPTVVATGDDVNALQLVVSEVGGAPAGERLGVVAWYNVTETASSVIAQLLDAEGEPMGEPQTLTDTASGLVTLAVASSSSGAAIVYGEAFGAGGGSLRFRAIDKNGIIGDERDLTEGTDTALNAGLVAIPAGAGYYLAYRSAIGGSAPVLRVAALDPNGNLGGNWSVAETSLTSSTVNLHLANDGRLFLIWGQPDTVETDAGSNTQPSMHAARLVCDG